MLQYPDYTCVVQYRGLVIGFGIVVPDIDLNEAYLSFLLVHPEWQGSGIGKFILYHLIQVCINFLFKIFFFYFLLMSRKQKAIK